MGFLNRSFEFTCYFNQDSNNRFPIFEYTLGSKVANWISGLMRLDQIVDETVRRSTESDTNIGPRKNRLVIAAKDEGGVARYVQGRPERLRIYIHHGSAAKKASKMFEFEKIKYVGPPELVRALFFIPLPIPVRLYTFEYFDATKHEVL